MSDRTKNSALLDLIQYLIPTIPMRVQTLFFLMHTTIPLSPPYGVGEERTITERLIFFPSSFINPRTATPFYLGRVPDPATLSIKQGLAVIQGIHPCEEPF